MEFFQCFEQVFIYLTNIKLRILFFLFVVSLNVHWKVFHYEIAVGGVIACTMIYISGDWRVFLFDFGLNILQNQYFVKQHLIRGLLTFKFHGNLFLGLRVLVKVYLPV